MKATETKSKTEVRNFTSESEATAYWNKQGNSLPRPVRNELDYNKDGTFTVTTTLN